MRNINQGCIVMEFSAPAILSPAEVAATLRDAMKGACKSAVLMCTAHDAGISAVRWRAGASSLAQIAHRIIYTWMRAFQLVETEHPIVKRCP